MQLNVAIGVWHKGNYLILRRSDLETNSGIWEFPAGKVDYNETGIQACKRELKEETGIESDKLVFIGTTKRLKGKSYVLSLLFLCESKSDKVTLSEEHDEYLWLSKDEINKREKMGIETRKILEKLEL